jgi:hypothetical protein
VVDAGRSVLRGSPLLVNEESWCGFRPLTPDGLPVIGRVPAVRGLLIATGHAMLGFTQATATGRLVADLAGGRRWLWSRSARTASRPKFRRGHHARSRIVSIVSGIEVTAPDGLLPTAEVRPPADRRRAAAPVWG